MHETSPRTKHHNHENVIYGNEHFLQICLENLLICLEIKNSFTKFWGSNNLTVLLELSFMNILSSCWTYFAVGANGSGKTNFFHGKSIIILVPIYLSVSGSFYAIRWRWLLTYLCGLNSYTVCTERPFPKFEEWR